MFPSFLLKVGSVRTENAVDLDGIALCASKGVNGGYQTCSTVPTPSKLLTLVVDSTNSPPHPLNQFSATFAIQSYFSPTTPALSSYLPTSTALIVASVSPDPATQEARTLTTKAKVGIGISVGVVVFMAVCLGILSVMYVQKKRKERERALVPGLQTFDTTDCAEGDEQKFPEGGQGPMHIEKSLDVQRLEEGGNELRYGQDDDERVVLESSVEVVFEDDLGGFGEEDDGDDEHEEEELQMQMRGRPRRKSPRLYRRNSAL